jgi:hypothetical protein
MSAVCHWRLAGNSTADEACCFYSTYNAATMVGNSTITCAVPSRTSSISGNPGPAEGGHVYVAVSVWDTESATHATHGVCMSHYGSDSSNYGEFTYETPCTDNATNAIVNGDAESGTASWNGYPVSPSVQFDAATSSNVFVLSNDSAVGPRHQTQSIAVPAGARYVTIKGWIHNSVANSGITGYGYMHGTQGGGTPTAGISQWIQSFTQTASLSSGWIEMSKTAPMLPGATSLLLKLARSSIAGHEESGNVARFDNITVVFHCDEAPPTPAPTASPTPAPRVRVVVGRERIDARTLDDRKVASVFALNFDEINATDLALRFKAALIRSGVRESTIESISVFPGSVVVVTSFVSASDASSAQQKISTGNVTVTSESGAPITAALLDSGATGSSEGSSSSGDTTAVAVGVIVPLVVVIAVVAAVVYKRSQRKSGNTINGPRKASNGEFDVRLESGMENSVYGSESFKQKSGSFNVKNLAGEAPPPAASSPVDASAHHYEMADDFVVPPIIGQSSPSGVLLYDVPTASDNN